MQIRHVMQGLCLTERPNCLTASQTGQTVAFGHAWLLAAIPDLKVLSTRWTDAGTLHNWLPCLVRHAASQEAEILPENNLSVGTVAMKAVWQTITSSVTLPAAHFRGPHAQRTPERTSSVQTSSSRIANLVAGELDLPACHDMRRSRPRMHGAPWLAGRRLQSISPATASTARGRVAAPPPQSAAVSSEARSQ